jgi:Xaa-Pro aminopeptidase
MRHDLIPATLFTDRRKAFAKKMERGSIAIFYSHDPMPRTSDQHFPFRQHSHLYALSGLDQPETILVIYPDAKNESVREIAFIRRSDPLQKLWNGDLLTAAQAKKISGIDTIRMTDQWDKIMIPLFRTSKIIYVNSSDPDNPSSVLKADREYIELKKAYPNHSIRPALPILTDLLMVKHPVEIQVLKYAVNVTGKAFDRALRCARPKMKEYELEAELTYELVRNGCQHAFEPIVASGKSACTLHYIQNDKIIKPGSLILLDFGAEYASMASDMTRTIPASGKFSARQRQIYNSVLTVLTEITQLMRPGILITELNREAGKLIQSELIRLKIISKNEVARQDKAKPLWKKYFMHGISHHLGYDVHDVSDKSVPLKSGMVLTCEPGLYVPEESTGIRLENDILITGKGPQNLMKSIPIDPDEIEMIMQKSRE